MALEQLRAFVAANDLALIKAAQMVAHPEQYLSWEVRKARKLLGIPEPPPVVIEEQDASDEDDGAELAPAPPDEEAELG